MHFCCFWVEQWNRMSSHVTKEKQNKSFCMILRDAVCEELWAIGSISQLWHVDTLFPHISCALTLHLSSLFWLPLCSATAQWSNGPSRHSVITVRGELPLTPAEEEEEAASAPGLKVRPRISKRTHVSGLWSPQLCLVLLCLLTEPRRMIRPFT